MSNSHALSTSTEGEMEREKERERGGALKQPSTMHSGKRKGNKPGFGTGRIPHILEHGRKEEREWTGESDPLLNVLVLLKKK